MATTAQVISKIQKLGGFIEISEKIPANVKNKLENLVLQRVLYKAPKTEISNEIYFFPNAVDSVAEYLYEAVQEVRKIVSELS